MKRNDMAPMLIKYRKEGKKYIIHKDCLEENISQ